MAESVLTNPIVKSFLAGSFSGTCSTILFQPLDLVKTRIQQNHYATLNASGEIAAVQSTNIYSTLRVVIANESVTGLWKGIAPSITRTVPGVGLYFASLHALKSNMGKDGQKPGPVQAVALGKYLKALSPNWYKN